MEGGGWKEERETQVTTSPIICLDIDKCGESDGFEKKRMEREQRNWRMKTFSRSVAKEVGITSFEQTPRANSPLTPSAITPRTSV